MSTLSELTLLATRTECLKKLIFSKPKDDGVLKICARLCAHRGRRMLAAEYSLPGNTVAQKNVTEDGIADFLERELCRFDQVNLLSTAGDAEFKRTKRGEVLLGADKLMRKLSGGGADFEKAIGELDKRKNYILGGSEDFLIALGISDKSGRVHDKKQAKYRQINKFLEYLDELYPTLAGDGELTVFDLCCGKSYLSFAVYHYLTAIKGRRVNMLCIDLKADVIAFCDTKARELSYNGMHFVCDDITNTPREPAPDLVISLHACDVATDIVLDTAVRLGARLILSTPCCQAELARVISPTALPFVTKYPKLARSLCDTLTDALRLERLRALGYDVNATELVDPEDTPKNTLIRATLRRAPNGKLIEEYNATLRSLLGDAADGYIGKINDD